MKRTPRSCPKCGNRDVIPIVYGYPLPETMEAAERGEVEQGGCCVTGDDPTLKCRACGEEFGGLDESCGQLSQERLVGLQKIVLGKFAGQNPGGLLKSARGESVDGNLRGEKMDFQRFGSAGITMPDAGDFHAFFQRDTQFFLQFAAQRLFKRFARAHLAAGEFPFQRGSIAAAALADKQAAVRAFNDGSDDVQHEVGNFIAFGNSWQSDACNT